jgi:excisionase family DNA binding protein
MTTDRFISRQEAAVALRVSVADIDRLIAVGLLARYRLRGLYVRVLRSQVDELASVPAEWLRNA